MKIQTSQISISQKTYESFLENCDTNDVSNPDPNILDSGINSPKISDPYLIELERKYVNLANSTLDNFRIHN